MGYRCWHPGGNRALTTGRRDGTPRRSMLVKRSQREWHRRVPRGLRGRGVVGSRCPGGARVLEGPGLGLGFAYLRLRGPGGRGCRWRSRLRVPLKRWLGETDGDTGRPALVTDGVGAEAALAPRTGRGPRGTTDEGRAPRSRWARAGMGVFGRHRGRCPVRGSSRLPSGGREPRAESGLASRDAGASKLGVRRCRALGLARWRSGRATAIQGRGWELEAIERRGERSWLDAGRPHRVGRGSAACRAGCPLGRE